MKNILILLILIFLAKLAFAKVEQTSLSVPALSGHVNDYAGILSDQVRKKLEKQLQEHEDSTSNQIVVLTIASLNGEQIEEEANKIFNTWQLGQKEKNNGVLILIAPNERKMRIEVGYGLESVLTDAHCSRIIRNELTPNFKNKKYDEGILAGVSAIRQAIYGTYSAEDPGFFESLLTYEGIGFPDCLPIGTFVMGILLIFTLVVIFAEGIVSWFLFFFLMVFYLTFPFFIFGSIMGFCILAAYIGIFIWSKIWFCTTSGKAFLKKIAYRNKSTSSSTGAYRSTSSSRSSFRSSTRSSYSGGGGRSGGGGSSGSW